MNERLIEKAIEIFGISDSCKYSTFILPNGKALNILKDMNLFIDYHPHAQAAEKVIGKSAMPSDEFIDLTGSIRYVPMRSTINIQLGLKNPLTNEQLEFIERCACYQKPEKCIVYDFVADNEIVETNGIFDEPDCFKGIDKLKKEFNKFYTKYNE